jgi:adenylosuccinate synthase
MPVDVLLGLQWGDEGKGKIVDYIAKNYDIIARFQGGPNAGHTIIIKCQKHVLHTIPSGVFRPDCINIIGNGVVVDPIVLTHELKSLEKLGITTDKILLARKAHLILPTHRYLDAASEASKGKEKIGSTLRGIGPTYMDKTGRNGMRIGDIESENFRSQYENLKEKHLQLGGIYPKIEFDLATEEKRWFESLDYINKLEKIDCAHYINDALDNGKSVLAEGAQGSMLDIDYGTYPFVTSSNTLSSGVCVGLGLAPSRIGNVIGISKSYCTRVGSGPFPTELNDETGEKLRKVGHEFGATTGRPRRTGWIDLVQLKYTIMINGVNQLCITKMDCLNDFEHIKMATQYKLASGTTDKLPYDLEDQELEVLYDAMPGWLSDVSKIGSFDALPQEARSYIQFLESYLGVGITMISTGPERESLLLR